MKILVLSDDFPPYVAGGAGVIAFRLSKEFVRQGHQVVVISTVREKGKEGNIEFEGINVSFLHSEYGERWRSYISLCNPFILRKIKKIISDFSPDVVHIHNVHAHLSYASIAVAKKYSKKVFMTAHDIMPFYPGTFAEFINQKDLSCPKSFTYKVSFAMLAKKFRFRFNPLRNLIIRYFLSKTTKIIAVSDALREALCQNKIKNICVIHNGINVSEWNVSQGEIENFKKSFSLSDSKIILFQGRLSGAKGGELILKALAKISSLDPRVKLLVIGRKDFYAEKMRKRTQELGIENKVIFSGWLDEAGMKRAYSASDVVVIPSVCFDSFPNGNLEAFASGKPVVATCFGGSREIVKDGENGFIVNPFDVSNLAEKLLILLSDYKKNKEYGENGRALVTREYSIEKAARSYIDLFTLSI